MKDRIRELDGIRGLAILMVLVWHYFTCQEKSIEPGTVMAYFYYISSSFWSGVDLFFVLSGFLIGGIILDHHQKPGFLKVFWIRRCCRILPVLSVLLLSCWVLGQVLDGKRYGWLFEGLMPWWSYPVFLQNVMMGMEKTFGGHFLGVTWSLAVEEQFYLFAPILILLLGRRRWVMALMPLVLFAFFLRLSNPGFQVHVNTMYRMDALLSGVVVAVVYRTPEVWSILVRSRGLIAACFGVLLLISESLVVLSKFGEFRFSWFALLYFVLLLVVLLFQGTRVMGVLRSSALTFWGGISYGLYLFHQAVSGLLHGWLRNGAVPGLVDSKAIQVTVLAFGVSTLLAWVSFHTLEAFFLRLGKRWTFPGEGS